ILKRAAEHKGSAFVEIYQNCNVFNDGAFEKVTGKDVRADMLIPLEHGKPIRFGQEAERGLVLRPEGRLEIVNVEDVGEDALLVHDETLENPGLAFMLSRLAHGPFEPTPIGVFRAVDRPDYATLAASQIAEVEHKKGTGDLASLLRSGTTWTVS
ncbi:MAG TPA: 2-oxoacid:ferredoxin oxidoreductase subunit beta, partial [Acidimicrobiales bacterium]|nr:2-oxoacid:ferredoxin oxidoreductase subunit beta [Acidimicrobiales bacterium]